MFSSISQEQLGSAIAPKLAAAKTA